MTPRLEFINRDAFREWLSVNALSDTGVWLVFYKKRSAACIKASEALEEALCFGWIDGQMQSIDGDAYIKYFKQRSPESDWSEKNKKLTANLEERGLMTDFGRAKIELAKQNGHWERAKPAKLSDEQLAEFDAMVRPHDAAYANFEKMPPSMRRTYASSYFLGTKTEEGRKKRFATILERLERNLNPMESKKK
ncbi:MAG: YdeI/OmpD-associated family protein [Clostridia bacterium]|nr:YdeI/OmpD-associated family protein [Clostridia bacterium]